MRSAVILAGGNSRRLGAEKLLAWLDTGRWPPVHPFAPGLTCECTGAGPRRQAAQCTENSALMAKDNYF